MYSDIYLKILEEELIIAVGCTEPIAVAYATALAKYQIPNESVRSIRVQASQGIIKNAMFVNIPNIEGYGLKLAAAVGALCGDSSCHLEVLHNVTPQCVSDAKELAAEAVTVELAENVPDVYVNVTLKTANHIACVVISDRHDLVTEIMLDDKVLFSDTANERDYPDLMYATNLGDLGDLYEFVMNVPLDKLNLIELSIEHNYKIALEGLQSDYGLMVGRIMHKTTQTTQTKNTLNPNTSSLSQMINHVVSITAAGTDARMAGISLPVMSNSGSGNQGICATVPVVAVAEQLDSRMKICLEQFY